MSDERLRSAEKKFSRLLKQIFQFDCADLDFGIYRVLAMRRSGLETYLDQELLPQVRTILADATGGQEPVADKLAKLEETFRSTGMTDEEIRESTPWKKLKAELGDAVDLSSLAREVFGDLTTFFSRYYDEGDFMALPRGKADSYVIPHDGSEVKLHWANADQYYIKTTERHADYTAELESVPGLERPRLRLRLASAEADQDISKIGEKRRYVLSASQAVEVQDNELTVRFEYRVPEPAKKGQPTQKALCQAAERTILDAVPSAWQVALTRKAAQNPDSYTVLGYQLYRYSKKNTADYFIHKDLSGFFTRELDFYIKNEVLHLDDLEGRSAAELDGALQRVRAIRAVGGKIIAWLAQAEDFQKRLYLKGKFVLKTEWYASSEDVTADDRSTVVAACEGADGWKALFGDAPASTPMLPAPIVVGSTWAEATPHGFAERLGDRVQRPHLIVHADNQQGLRLLGSALNGTAGLVYIDPPYNTGNDGFLYRDGYKRSSWASMMRERLHLGRQLLRSDGLFLCSISDIEVHTLRRLQDQLWGEENHLATVIWNTEGNIDNQSKIKENHEYVTAYAASKEVWPAPLVMDPNIDASSKLHNDTIENSITKNGPANPPSTVTLPVGFPCDFESGTIDKDEKRWPELSNDVVVSEGRTTQVVDARSGWSSRSLLDAFLQNGLEPIADQKGRKTWFKIRKTGAIYMYKERGDERSHVLSVLRNLGTTKQTSGDLGRMGLDFDYPKPVGLVEYLCSWCNDSDATIVDFFGGSGTTAHAVLNLNRKDGGDRRYALIEGGNHFSTVTLPRVLKSTVSDKWEGGRPKTPAVPRGVTKVLYLESYDDTLENLELQRPDETQALLDASASLREDYTLRYMLDMESRGSLLDLERFDKPWDYTIQVRRDGVRQASPVDLVETFNHLLGLSVSRYDTRGQQGLLFVHGAEPGGRAVLVVWRDCEQWSGEALEAQVREVLDASEADGIQAIYVNGDSHLATLKGAEESWDVLQTEEAFLTRMFDTSEKG